MTRSDCIGSSQETAREIRTASHAIAAAFAAAGWQWTSVGGVPGVREIEAEIYRQLDHLTEVEDGWSTSSGRIKCIRDGTDVDIMLDVLAVEDIIPAGQQEAS